MQRLAQLEDHAGGAQLGAAVGAERRMHERAVGQRRAGPVVIGYHHFESRRPRGGHLLDRGHPAVDRHEQLHPARGQTLHRGHREAVSLVEAARQLPLRIAAQRPQRAHEHGSGADAVDVVVTEHGDSRPALQVPQNQLTGARSTGQRARIVALARGQEAACLSHVGEAAAGEDRPDNA